MPAFRRVEASRRAIASLRAAGAERIVFVDDEGTAEGGALADEFPGLDVIRTEKPAWWTGAIVLGIERARAGGEGAVLFFNQDVTCAPDYFARLVATVEKNPGALVGSAILYAQEPGRVWSAGGSVEWWGRGIRVLRHGAPVSSLPTEPFPADWLFGMGTFVPCAVFDRIGLPDAARFPMAWGDLDFSLRAKQAGIPVLVDPAARLFHEVGEYDARVAGAPSARQYAGWLKDPMHNLSLSAHAEIWKRHGPWLLWPLSLAMRAAFLMVNFLRIRVLFPSSPSKKSSSDISR
ncbi:MAG: glycosyltransferase family 2 protein [Thermoanaerobaculia bacterium]